MILFSSPEPKARVSYCHSAPSVVRPSVVRPSVCRPSVRRKLLHFRLLLWNRWTEFNETWQKARSQRPLPSLCFSSRSEKQDGRPGLWLAETFSTSSLKPLNRIQQNLTGSKISMPSTKFVFFGPIGKTRWPPWPLIGWDIFDFSSETAEQNLTKLDRKQDLNALYQVCVFRADRKNKMAALASDWLRHFRLLLWNRWTEFNETWQEARSQRPLPSLCFSGRSEKQDGCPGLWLAETFLTSPLKPLNRIQQNLIGSKISKLFTKFLFFGPIRKTRWPPRTLIGWDIFDFSSETAERNSTNLDRKQDLNVLYQVCVFRADRNNKMAAWPLIGWDIFDFFSETAEWNSTKLDRNQDLNALYQVCVFFRRIGKTKWPPWPLIGWDIFDFSSKTTERNSAKLDRKKALNAFYHVCVFQANRETTKWPPWPLIGWDIFDFSSETVKGIRRNLIGKQDLNALYQVCVLQVDQKNKMAALAYDLLRHFQLFLWNCWIEFNKTW